MLSENSNTPTKEQDKDEQGGFVAMLHSLEKQIYGPETNDLTGSAIKILLYIRHRALRDWTKRKQIPKSEIIEATGLSRRSVERGLRELEKKKFLQVIRTKIGEVWSDNTYELHPDRYGDDYIYRTDKPNFKIIYGSKHKSNPSSKESYPQKDKLPSDMSVGVPTDMGVGVPTDVSVGSIDNYFELKVNLPPKNPLKEPYKRTLFEKNNFSSWTKEKTEEDHRKQRDKLRIQKAQLLKEYEESVKTKSVI